VAQGQLTAQGIISERTALAIQLGILVLVVILYVGSLIRNDKWRHSWHNLSPANTALVVLAFVWKLASFIGYVYLIVFALHGIYAGVIHLAERVHDDPWGQRLFLIAIAIAVIDFCRRFYKYAEKAAEKQ